jgi:tRNA-binding protein
MQPAEIKPEITIDDLNKLDIRIGTIEKAEEIPGSDKLLRLTVNFGDHTRVILSGMKQERDDINALEGIQTLFVVNMAPRKIFGEMSHGMIFDVGWEDGILPALIHPEREVPNGSRAG